MLTCLAEKTEAIIQSLYEINHSIFYPNLFPVSQGTEVSTLLLEEWLNYGSGRGRPSHALLEEPHQLYP